MNRVHSHDKFGRKVFMRLWRLSERKELAVLVICAALILTGCGGGKAAEENGGRKSYSLIAEKADNAAGGKSQMELQSEGETETEDLQDGETSAANQEYSDDASEEGDNSSDKSEPDLEEVRKEMLVYRGQLAVDTLEFAKSVKEFKKLVDKVGGFIENETYSDDAEINTYYMVEEDEKRNLFTARVRVPSSQYDTIMNAASDIGDLRSKQSNAENVTQQYGTYQSELKVYETERRRYLKLLEKAKEDEYALKLEEKLFDLQIKIADLKSSITNLETDVAYSYIDITICEVVEYQHEILERDTFVQRLKETCSDSWEGFLNVMEGILFLLIRIWYYIVIAFVIFCVIRKFRKNKAGKGRTEEDGTATEEQPADASLPEDGTAMEEQPIDESLSEDETVMDEKSADASLPEEDVDVKKENE